jgi:hypothetical protein
MGIEHHIDSFGDGLVDIVIFCQLAALPCRQVPQQARRFVAAGVDCWMGRRKLMARSQLVTVEEELEEFPGGQAPAREFRTLIPLTYSQVANCSGGAHPVNDGVRADHDLARVVARRAVPVILMHNRSSWVHAEIKEQLGGRYIGMEYGNLVEDIRNELIESVELAHQAGITDENIILDPGIGFGKTVEQNLELLDRLEEIRALGYPLLLGPSRKSFIGYTLNLPPERAWWYSAAVTIGIAECGYRSARCGSHGAGSPDG